MKKIITGKLTAFIFFALTFCVQNKLIAQQNVSINNDGSAPDPSAILDIKSGTKGLLIPRMDSVARKAIVKPPEGLIVFDTNYNTIYYYAAGLWNSVASNLSTIAFRAIKTTNFTTSSSNPISFDSVDFNIGGGFSGGFFIAPVDGVYHFDVAAAVQTSGLYLQLSLYKSSGGVGSRPFINLVRPRDGLTQTDVINITLQLKKNDVISIWVEPALATTVFGSTPDLTYFSGFKVN